MCGWRDLCFGKGKISEVLVPVCREEGLLGFSNVRM